MNVRKVLKNMQNRCMMSNKSLRETNHDNLILHISESWVDEREQRRDKDPREASIVDNLGPEIDTFLMDRQTANLDTKDADHKEIRLRGRSLDSVPEVGTPPADSTFSDARCAERSKLGSSHYREQEELALKGKRKGQSPPSVQMSEPQNSPPEMDSDIVKSSEGTPTEISMLQKFEICDSYQKKKNYDVEGHGSNSKSVEKLISELLLSEGGSLPPGYEYKEAVSNNPSSLKRNGSPVRPWVTSMKSPGPIISESSSKSFSMRGNSLKAKLQEPKLKGQRSRLKILKGSS